MIIVSRIIHVKVDRRLNVTNKFKYQSRLSSRLPIVMFRGTPCILVYILPIVGQTAGQNGLKFFLDTHGWPWSGNRFF